MLNTRFFRTPCALPPAVPSLKHVSSQLIVRGLRPLQLLKVKYNAAAAAGHSFYPAGFTEFAGWSTPAKAPRPSSAPSPTRATRSRPTRRATASTQAPRAPGPPASTAPSSSTPSPPPPPAPSSVRSRPRAGTAAPAVCSRRPSRTTTSLPSTARTSVATATPPCATTFCRPHLRLPPTRPRPRPHNVS